MRILYVSATPLEYSSSGNIRNTALINGLIEIGHEVHVLTSEADENNDLFDNTLLSPDVARRYYIPLGNIHKKFTHINKRRKGLQTLKGIVYKVINSFSLYDPRKKLIKRLDDIKFDLNYDLVISSSDPKSSHLIAEKLILKYKELSGKWLQYWGDPFSDDINKQTKLPTFLIMREERRLLSLADYVLYVSPFTLEEQNIKFKAFREKMFFLPIPYIYPTIYRATENNKFVLGYFGDYYSKDRNILPLYGAAKLLDKSVELVIYGNSDISLCSNHNVKVNTREKASKIKEIEGNCDLLICILNKQGSQIPGKVYHYAATNKPILIIVDGNLNEKMKEYFRKFNRYYICDNNEVSIMNTLQQIISNYKNNNYEPSSFFHPSIIARRLQDIIN